MDARAGNRLFGAVVALHPDPLLVCRPDGLIVEANQAARRCFGSATNVRLAVWPTGVALFDEAWRRAASGDGIVQQALEWKLVDGARLFTQSSLLGVDEGGEKFVLCALRDASEYRRLFSQLVQAEKLASMGRLAGGIAHQLNTPLGSILLTAEMLLDDTQSADAQRDIQKIIRQVNQCRDVIRQLLRFSQPGNTEVHESCSLTDIIGEVTDLLAKPLENQGVQVEQNLRCRDCRIFGNHSMLHQLFMHLFSNARDAMPDGGTLRIGSECTPGTVRVTLSDTGQGIPEGQENNIFDPFFTTKAVGDGTGLGLYISRRIAQEHGGNLELAATGPEGTSFVLTLPHACAVHTLPSGSSPHAASPRPGR